MTEPSPRADDRLDALRPILGAWDVAVTTFPTDSTTHQATGQAEVTYMNRGYAYQERRVVEDAAQGRTDHALSFLVFTPGPERWALGEGRSETEHIEVYDGDLDRDVLALRTAVRRGGGTLLTQERVTYEMADDAFTITVETSTDDGETWAPREVRAYTRRADVDHRPHAAVAPEHRYGLSTGVSSRFSWSSSARAAAPSLATRTANEQRFRT
ncbi:hypothetical protein [Rubrivirga sp. IMCC43871]|uniref:hypothetical protein n=1 Tax=Rubrivirga sp. IMCC43871 TaxID=3391575 RepID=UPI00398FEA6E